MAIKSDIQEEAPSQQKQHQAALAAVDEDVEVLKAVLERKGGALPFLQVAIDVAHRCSDLFRDPSALSKVTAMASVAREQVEAERKAREAKRAAKEVAAVTEEKNSSTNVEKEESKVKQPNAGNGLDLKKYPWTQQLPEVNISAPLPGGTVPRFLVCEIKKDHLKVGLKGQPAIIDSELHRPVKVDDCFWSIEDGNSLSILLTKQNQMEWWRSVIKGDPEVDTQRVEPESTRVSDLDPETGQTVEKMMFDQRQKHMGLPTSDEMQKEEMLKKFMSQHPEMDFSGAKMA